MTPHDLKVWNWFFALLGIPAALGTIYVLINQIVKQRKLDRAAFRMAATGVYGMCAWAEMNLREPHPVLAFAVMLPAFAMLVASRPLKSMLEHLRHEGLISDKSGQGVETSKLPGEIAPQKTGDEIGSQ